MKTIFMLLTAAMLLPPAGFAQRGTEGNIRWSIADGTLTIGGNGAMPDYTFDTASPWSSREDISAVIIENGVTCIGDYAFWDCSNLRAITVPRSVKTIGSSAFAVCWRLTSITVPDSVTTIENDAFDACLSLTSITVDAGNPDYTSENGVLFDKARTALILYPEGRTETDYNIPRSVAEIGDGAFSGCEHLTSVSIPNSVTTIGELAFFGCIGLTSVAIPQSVTRIETNAFSGCLSLTSFTVDADNPNYTAENGVLFNKAKTVLIRYPEGKAGTGYAIPGSVTAIGGRAFYGCGNLTSVAIPYPVETIGYYAFYRCDNLTSVAIPHSVETIENWAFDECGSLQNVTVGWTTPFPVKSEVFSKGNLKKCTLHVPSGTKGRYKAAAVWKKFGTITER